MKIDWNSFRPKSEESRLDLLAMKLAFLKRRGVAAKEVAAEAELNPVQLSQLLMGRRCISERVVMVEEVVCRFLERLE